MSAILGTLPQWYVHEHMVELITGLQVQAPQILKAIQRSASYTYTYE